MIFSLLAVLLGAVTFAQDWNVTTAAEPYKGTTIKALFLDRPGYAAAIDVIPQFEEATGIDVEWEILPYENSRERQVLDFTNAKQN